MQYVQGWRATMDARKAQAKLWPLLLIRYPGADVSNSPLRVRQQILGALVSGAQGIVLYNPSNMDANYWIMLADTMKDISSYEGYYQHGRRVEGIFSLRGMPFDKVNKKVWPGYDETVDASQWAFSAHEWQEKYVLTLFNLREQGDMEFAIVSSEKVKPIRLDGVTSKGDFKWVVPAGHIGFITLSKQ